MVCASSALYGFAGMVLCWRLLKQWVSSGIAAWATLLVVFASPLLLYLFHEGAYSHALGFFMGTAVVVLWWKRYEEISKPDSTPTLKLSASFGLVLGLAMLIRWQSAIFLIFPGFDFLSQAVRIFKNWEKEKKSIGRWLSSNAVLLLFLGIAIFPQLAVWKVQTGHWLHVPQGEGYFPNWWQPRVDKVLFSRLHGLFSWHRFCSLPPYAFPCCGKTIGLFWYGLPVSSWLNFTLIVWFMIGGPVGVSAKDDFALPGSVCCSFGIRAGETNF